MTHELEATLASLSVDRNEGEFVFVTMEDDGPPPAPSVASIDEPEGRSLVIDRRAADEAGLPYEFVAAWLTITTTTALDLVGLTAELSARLTRAGIPANVVAGRFHDHLFVPVARADEALRVLLSRA